HQSSFHRELLIGHICKPGIESSFGSPQIVRNQILRSGNACTILQCISRHPFNIPTNDFSYSLQEITSLARPTIDKNTSLFGNVREEVIAVVSVNAVNQIIIGAHGLFQLAGHSIPGLINLTYELISRV